MVGTGVKWAQEAHINWELNERISLSSGPGSARLGPASSCSSGCEEPPAAASPVQRRWRAARDKLDRTNAHLDKRLAVIDELNRKILASHERMREAAADRDRARSWRPEPPGCTLERQWQRDAAAAAAAQERTVLRQLNEAIDRFEEAQPSQGLDSSCDSGVGAEVAAVAATASGWLRVDTGLESSLVYLTIETSAADVCRDLLLADSLALFVQYGDEPGRRLSSGEKPLELQEELLLKLGYREPARRARLGLDAELRHLVRFHVGPAAPLDELQGYTRCGYCLVLKGLVFPQWKKRALAVVGSRLFLYPACSESRPEWMELESVCGTTSRLGKLVLRVTGCPGRLGQRSKEPRHLYLGFQHPWDRDLWRSWLKQAASEADRPPAKLDMSETGLSRLPEAVRTFHGLRDLFLGHNQLGRLDANLKILLSFPELQELHLENNRLGEFPRELLGLNNLTFLDLSDNEIQTLPPEIASLTSLRELILDGNEIKQLPEEIRQLGQLRHVSLAANLIELLPSFLIEMRALALGDVLPGRSEAGSAAAATADEKSNLHNSLYKVNLRNNQLKGNIILGNYGNLTHLDLSENSIEKLDLSALRELRSVRCARNELTELTLCGQSLVSLIAGNNKLKKVTIVPVPTNLEHLDVSYNELDSLPEWTAELGVLRALFASHNDLIALPERLFSSSRLEVLHLPHNRLQALPPPRRQLNLVHLTLQDNRLTALPANFFANTLKMKVLNLSNNRLSELAWSWSEEERAGRNNRQEDGKRSSLEKLYLTGNSLTNTALDALAKFTALRVLHLAYNALDTLPESCIASWKELEELVLSGNKLHYLPDNVANLAHLRVLRVHSNRLLTCPAFSKTSSLKVLDLAHNHLDRLNLDSLLPAQLQFLDISCNSRLRLDPRQFQSYNSARRPVSLVDVSAGQSRQPDSATRCTSPGPDTRNDQHLPWRLGFSETAGTRERLLVSQVRMPGLCGSEGLFGVFDGGPNQEAPSGLHEMMPRLLVEEREAKGTRSDYLRYTLLSAGRELRDKGHKYGLDAALVHLSRPDPTGRYLLTAASCGEARAVLCRANGPLHLAKPATDQYLPRLHAALAHAKRKNDLLPVAEPTTQQVTLEEDDELIIIGNRRLWEVVSLAEAVREARAEANPVLAAKRLQDLGQAYGAEDNLSVLVVRLSGAAAAPANPAPAEPLDKLLMRELRQAVHATKPDSAGCTCPCCMPRPPGPSETPAPCCCHAANNSFYLNGALRSVASARSSAKSSRSSERACREERSSPSGQSDGTSDVGLFEPRSRKRTSGRGGVASKLRQQQQQQQLASPVERTPPPTDEQLRCWEYMLEQNTQLLFDKELDTLTSVAARPSSALRRAGQSRSTPQLQGSSSVVGPSGQHQLSRRFGSARSFDAAPMLPPTNLLMRPTSSSSSSRRLLNGGPNAAYFGSLQRLMPYNLEYDFAVIQERGALDSLEHDSRMQQYWGVATTEL